MIVAFLLAFIFSFIGSIPPGAINISVIQLSIENHKKAALRFSFAAAIVEFPYVLIAVVFSEWLLSNQLIIENIKLISIVVIFVLAIINTTQYFIQGFSKPKTNFGGFKRGMIISIFNPLAIPFWMGVTAYLIEQKWLIITDTNHLIAYATGVSFGTLCLLVTLILLAKNLGVKFKNQKLTKLIPAVVFYILGFYGLYELLF